MDVGDLAAVTSRLRAALGDSRGKLRVGDGLLLAGFARRTLLRAKLVGVAMLELGWERGRRRFDGTLESAFSRGSSLEREVILEAERGEDGRPVLRRREP